MCSTILICQMPHMCDAGMQVWLNRNCGGDLLWNTLLSLKKGSANDHQNPFVYITDDVIAKNGFTLRQAKSRIYCLDLVLVWRAIEYAMLVLSLQCAVIDELSHVWCNHWSFNIFFRWWAFNWYRGNGFLCTTVRLEWACRDTTETFKLLQRFVTLV